MMRLAVLFTSSESVYRLRSSDLQVLLTGVLHPTQVGLREKPLSMRKSDLMPGMPKEGSSTKGVMFKLSNAPTSSSRQVSTL